MTFYRIPGTYLDARKPDLFVAQHLVRPIFLSSAFLALSVSREFHGEPLLVGHLDSRVVVSMPDYRT